MSKYIGWRWGEGRIPARNIHLGVSVEDQQRADERIPHLLNCPAAVRFISAEPLVGPVDLSTHLGIAPNHEDLRGLLRGVIVGGESGHNRRRMETEWAESLKSQCSSAGVAFFMKQIEVDGKIAHDIDAFPESLRVRQFPEVAAAVH